MADSVVEPLYGSRKAEPASLKRIRRLALPFEFAFAGFAVLAGLFFITLLIMSYAPGGYVTFNAEGGWLTLDPATAPEDALPVTAFSPIMQITGLITVTVIYGGLIIALWSLHKLFQSYRKGVVFAPMPIRLMRHAGLGLIIFASAPGLMQPLMRSLGSPDRNWFHGETIPILIVGAALFLFAHIISLGVELERENKGFI
ncbi:MAG: hypothetical protein AAF683_08225 [Pseudomonadota bacterium]